MLSGACLMLSATSVPFLAIRSLVRSCPPAPSAGSVPGFDGVEPSDALLRFDAWLDRLCAERTVMLIVDDLHWADESTLDLLTYLFAGPADRRLLVAGTIRSGEAPDGSPLQAWLANARRFPRVGEIALDPLDREATTAQLAEILGGQPHQSLVEDVVHRTGGNPFFIRLIATGLRPSDRRAPRTPGGDLRSVLLQSWSRLATPARELSRILAVAGRPTSEVELADVAALTGIGPALDELVQAGVVDVDPDGHFWFHHPLIAEVLDQEMTRDLRARWDTAFAERIERTMDPEAPSLGELVALADHHHRGGHRREAYRWALRAADATEATGGVTESVNLLRRALALQAGLPDEPETRRFLLERVRRVASAGGRYAEELDAVDDLMLEVGPEAEPLVMAELLVRRLHLRFLSGHSFFLPADAAEAVRLAGSDPTSWQHALALAELTHALTWVQDPSVAGVGERALAVARQVGDARALSFALTANAIVASDAGRTDDAARLAEEAFGAALQAEDWFAAVHAALWQANATRLSSSRPPAEVLSACREQLTAAGAPQLYVGWISACEAHGRLALGQVTECSALLRQALGADTGPYADVLARLVAARLAALQGRTGDAETHLARVEELIASGSAFVALPYDAVKVEVVLAGGDPRRAYQLASSAARSAVEVAPPTMSDWLVPLAARALADVANDDRDRGVDPAPTLALVDALQQAFPAVVVDRGTEDAQWQRQIEAHTAWYEAEIGRARGDPGNSEQWIGTAKAFGAGGLRWEELYATGRAAQALLAGGYGNRREAAELIRSGLALADALQSAAWGAELEQLAARARISTARLPVAGPAAGGTLPGLTRREAEILEHLVAGRTYREIARALVISEKAVSSHVSNMLRKTGAANRLELAGRAVRAQTPRRS